LNSLAREIEAEARRAMSDTNAAIDQGYSTGARAFFFAAYPERVSAAVHGQVDGANFAARLEQMRPDVAAIDRVSAMPRQGVASTFKFGTTFRIIIGVVGALKNPTHFVAPGKWKRHFGLSADKEESRARALQLWPARSDPFAHKKDQGRSEARLARFYAETVERGR
jgi:crossover junction endodeoxyribonuclease RuvC